VRTWASGRLQILVSRRVDTNRVDRGHGGDIWNHGRGERSVGRLGRLLLPVRETSSVPVGFVDGAPRVRVPRVRVRVVNV
jgi:hypothetical protein